MTDLTDLTIAEARDKLAARDISARDLTKAAIDAMEGARELNAFVAETPDRALAMADEADKRLASGDAQPMTGIPVAVKDLFCTKDVRTTAVSHML